MLSKVGRRTLLTSGSTPRCIPASLRTITRTVQPLKVDATAPHQPSYSDYERFPLSDSLDTVSNRVFSRESPRVFLPSPLPADRTSTLNALHYPPSREQEALAVIEACLHKCHDVRRAKFIFDDVRIEARNARGGAMDTTLYNKFISAFIEMAGERDVDERNKWVEDSWDLYEQLESGVEGIYPDANTYAMIFLTLVRFSPTSHRPLLYTFPRTASELLTKSIMRGIPTSLILSRLQHLASVTEQIPNLESAHPQLNPQGEIEDLIKILQQSAVEQGRASLVTELGVLSGETRPDPLEGVPEVRPVVTPDRAYVGYRPKKPSTSKASTPETLAPDGPEPPAPFNLTTLRQNLSEVVAARKALPTSSASARQKLLEESAYEAARVRFQHENKMMDESGAHIDMALGRASLQKWMWAWYNKLLERLKVEIERTREEEKDILNKYLEKPNGAKSISRQPALSPFLTLLKPEKLALITILELMRLSGSGGVSEGMKTARALISVGHAVELEHNAELAKTRSRTDRDRGLYTFDENEKDGQGGLELIRERRRLAKEAAAASFGTRGSGGGEPWAPEWTQTVKVRLGSFLVDALMDTATVTRTVVDPRTEQDYSEDQPAFNHEYEYIRGRKLGVIKLNPVVAERLATDPIESTLHPRHLPMLVRPRPWLAFDQGAYLYNKSSAMRIKDSFEQLSYLKEASNQGNLELVYSGLDVLGSTPWVINRGVFEVMLEVWNSGKELGGIPPVAIDTPEPTKPDEFETDAKAKTSYLLRLKEVIAARRNNHSERCHVNYKMEIARAFLGDKFYLPHNVDFRGRAYPIPPHLNHIGDDMSRGLLKFAESKPLGERGLRWLKIHLANLYGFDKASFDERETWVMDRLEHIYDSATKPLTGDRWWTKADDPWQCLSTCKELHAALESPNPLEFESSLPVHQDGTCNGLQHYAALGGDQVGAQQVNLAVTERPSDVYTFVANMVEKHIAVDAEKGNKYAKLLQGKISRKVVKQTVMTTVYGVTYIGARAQIERQLRDRGDVPREDLWEAAAYLAKHTLSCIEDLFAGAKAIQTWLTQAGRLVAKSVPPERVQEAQEIVRTKTGTTFRALKEQMTSVIWTTPMGLPIVQPYRKTKRKQVATVLQTVFISDPNLPTEVNPQKQATAFPPNFIHSLDATHMMLTALQCRQENLTFASVHDSYWTHASCVDKMSEIIRDTFIGLHSSDIMGKLKEEFLQRYDGHSVPVISLNENEIRRINADGKVHITRRPKKSRRGAIASPEGEESPSLGLSEEDVGEDVDADAKLPEDVLAADIVVEGLSKSKDGDEATPAYRQFIPLKDIIPELPAKGNFSVATIKQSLYFFS